MEFLLPLLLTLPDAAGAMIAAGLAIAIMVSGSMLMIAYGFQNPQMIAMAKEEVAAMIFTMFIIFFWLAFDTTLNTAVYGLISGSLPPAYQSSIAVNSCVSGSGPGCIGNIAISHLTLAIASLDVVEQKLRSQYIDLFLFEALIGFLSTISFPFGSPTGPVAIISFTLAPFTGLVLLSNAHTAVVETIGLMLTLVWSKKFILIFSRDIVPILLLPLGLVFRAIPLFRKTGSSIIAMSFALFYMFPFALIFSNYLIFDIFQPADFAYTPTASSFFDTDRDYSYWSNSIDEAREGDATGHMAEQFRGGDIAATTYDDPTSSCSGNFVVHMFCSAKNIISAGVNAFVGFFSTVWNIWRFMMGMTGDFVWSIVNNPALPTSASAGLYYFIIQEVTTVSPFIILIILTTVIEIIFTVTMYRNIALIIGGDVEIIGMTKIV